MVNLKILDAIAPGALTAENRDSSLASIGKPCLLVYTHILATISQVGLPGVEPGFSSSRTRRISAFLEPAAFYQAELHPDVTAFYQAELHPDVTCSD